MYRRQFLGLGLAGMVLLHQRRVLGEPAPATPRKFVWIILRGALDPLHTVVPAFDRGLGAARGVLFGAIDERLLPLDDGYGLHPQLKTLHSWYRERSFAPVVAVATQYRSRSHFDAQDVLECGLMPVEHDNGWLARALGAYHGESIAIARSLPITLRGTGHAQTWYPSTLPSADEDLYQRLLQLYQHDDALRTRLQEGLATREGLEIEGAQSRRPRFANLTRACGQLLADNADASCAVLEMSGWDTHTAQINRLDRQFRQFDEGLQALREALGAQWSNTLIAIGTEFGRTVAINGTGGTDHGTASVLLLAGGALGGGRVLGEWPGLASADLFEGRDLRPTSDIRSWIGAALAEHWSLDGQQQWAIFPGAEPVPMRSGTLA